MLTGLKCFGLRQSIFTEVYIGHDIGPKVIPKEAVTAGLRCYTVTLLYTGAARY